MQNLPDLLKEFKLATDRDVPDKLYYFHSNHLGSGSLITDKNGATYQTLAYAPWGEDLVNIRHYSDWYDERNRFTGQMLDAESGLYYYVDRYYNPYDGFNRSTDRHTFRYPHQSPYVYSNNNPIMYNDPTGKDGEITGEGTKEKPFIVHANYYYKTGSLEASEVRGLNAAIKEYNNGGKARNIKGQFVKFELSAQEVDDVDAAIKNDVFAANETSRGNKVTAGDNQDYTKQAGLYDKFGIGNGKHINLDRTNIAQGENDGYDRAELIKGVFLHELGHNLGLLEDDNTSIMNGLERKDVTNPFNSNDNHTNYFYYSIDKKGIGIMLERVNSSQNDGMGIIRSK
jgi:RHS repeat-associated protein